MEVASVVRCVMARCERAASGIFIRKEEDWWFRKWKRHAQLVVD